MAMIRPETEMKDSGIEWEKIVPIEWNKCRLKDYFEFEKGKNAQIYTKDYIGLHKGNFPVYSGQTENDGVMGEIDTYDYELDECLFSTTVGAKVMTPKVLSGKFSLSQNCLIMRKIRKCVIRFVYYALFPLFDYERTKIPAYMQPSLRIEDLKSYKLYMPLYTEQQAIADYLDETCSKIDEIIAEAKTSIDEYKELKQSVIFEAVTKGLDKNVEMKQCSVNWLDEIPSTWESIRLKYLLTEINNRSETGTEQPLSVSQVMGVVPSYMIAVANPTASYVGQKIVEPNDIVFNKLKAHLGVFFMSKYHGLVSPDYAVYRTNDKVIPKYLEYLFHTSACISEFKKYISGVAEGLMRLYTSDLFNIRICLPKVDEQIKIVEYVENKVELFDSLIAEKESLINDLESYKKSLIYEVVTGKRRVV